MKRLAVAVACAILATVAPATGASSRADKADVITAQGSDKRLWSDPTTWGGSLPAVGEKVTIPYGSHVVLDLDTPSLGGVRVDGKLSFARKDLALTTDWIMVHGTFQIGSESKPFEQRAVVTLTGRGQDVMGMGTRALGVMGGRLELHGKKIAGWTRLGATAEAGDPAIRLERKLPWRAGDKIAISSTSYASYHDEERTIDSADDNELQLDSALTRQHWGEVQTLAGYDVDERAEVALLSRNIVIRGASDSTDDGFGGHVMMMEGAAAHIEGVEFYRMGQEGRLARYPVHFHMDGDAGDSYIKRSSIHHSFNRCITIHGTDGVLVKGNVCFDHIGHGFFLEDGAETDNVFKGNLGFGTRSVEDGLLPSDRSAATYWITNPDNVLKGNVAAGSDGFGFWYALPEHPTGPSADDSIWPRRTPLKRFAGNVAHSNYTGLNVDDGPRPNGKTEATWYRPVEDPTDEDSAEVVARFENLVAFMNRDRGVWLRGENHVVTHAVLADNRSGATFASSETVLKDSVVVGESANRGTVEEWEETGPGGRALPFPWEPDAQVTGFEFYDGRVGVKDTTFVSFQPNAVRPSGALSYLAPDAFSIHPGNYAEGITFVDSRPVYLAPPEEGTDGDNSKVFVDADGSVTGTAGRAVVVDNPFLLVPGCDFRPAWNAHVCNADYGSLMVGSMNGDPDAIKPLILKRADGTKQKLMGCCDDSTEAWTTILPDRDYTVSFNALPNRFRFVLWRGEGTWVTVKIDVPGGVKVDRWGWPLDEVQSMGALNAADDSAYMYSNGALTLRLVATGDWEEIRVTRD
jgi:cell migration-inducing and hyaluronan-binding protein